MAFATWVVVPILWLLAAMFGAADRAELLQPWVHLDIGIVAVYGTSFYITHLSDYIQPPTASSVLDSLVAAPPPSPSAAALNHTAPSVSTSLLHVVMPVGVGVLGLTVIAASLTTAPFLLQEGGPYGLCKRRSQGSNIGRRNQLQVMERVDQRADDSSVSVAHTRVSQAV